MRAVLAAGRMRLIRVRVRVSEPRDGRENAAVCARCFLVDDRSHGACRVFTLQSRPTILIDARRGGRRCANKCNEPFCAIESPPPDVVFARAPLEDTGNAADLAPFAPVKTPARNRRTRRRSTPGGKGGEWG